MSEPEYEADPRDCCPRCGGAKRHRAPCLNVSRDVDSDNAAAGGAEGLADSVYRTGLVNLPLADSLDVDCHDVARAVLASDWLAAHDAKARADERERIAQAIQRAKPPHLTRDYTPVDAAYDTAARIARGES